MLEAMTGIETRPETEPRVGGAYADETALPFRQTFGDPFEPPFGPAVEITDRQPKGWLP